MRTGTQHGILPCRVENIHIMRLLIQRDVMADIHSSFKELHNLSVDFINLFSAVFQISHGFTPSFLGEGTMGLPPQTPSPLRGGLNRLPFSYRFAIVKFY